MYEVLTVVEIEDLEYQVMTSRPSPLRGHDWRGFTDGGNVV